MKSGWIDDHLVNLIRLMLGRNALALVFVCLRSFGLATEGHGMCHYDLRLVGIFVLRLIIWVSILFSYNLRGLTLGG